MTCGGFPRTSCGSSVSVLAATKTKRRRRGDEEEEARPSGFCRVPRGGGGPAGSAPKERLRPYLARGASLQIAEVALWWPLRCVIWEGGLEVPQGCGVPGGKKALEDRGGPSRLRRGSPRCGRVAQLPKATRLCFTSVGGEPQELGGEGAAEREQLRGKNGEFSGRGRRPRRCCGSVTKTTSSLTQLTALCVPVVVCPRAERSGPRATTCWQNPEAPVCLRLPGSSCQGVLCHRDSSPAVARLAPKAPKRVRAEPWTCSKKRTGI